VVLPHYGPSSEKGIFIVAPPTAAPACIYLESNTTPCFCHLDVYQDDLYARLQKKKEKYLKRFHKLTSVWTLESDNVAECVAVSDKKELLYLLMLHHTHPPPHYFHLRTSICSVSKSCSTSPTSVWKVKSSLCISGSAIRSSSQLVESYGHVDTKRTVS
jgi:hypothetical protein